MKVYVENRERIDLLLDVVSGAEDDERIRASGDDLPVIFIRLPFRNRPEPICQTIQITRQSGDGYHSKILQPGID